MQNQEVILCVGTEGGGVTLFGQKQTGKWTFFFESNDHSLVLIEEGGVVSKKSQAFFAFEDAITAFDTYLWHRHYPLEIHPEFRDWIWKEVCSRWAKELTADDFHIEDWQLKTKPQPIDDLPPQHCAVHKEKVSSPTAIEPADTVSPVQQKLDIVYVLTNPVMPGLVKIGYTTQSDAKIRIDQLFTTGVPVPFDIAFACRVGNAAEVERALHIAFSPHRINPKREFFQIEPEQAIVILKLLHTEETTAEVEGQPSIVDQDSVLAAQQVKAKRPNMNFIEMGIPQGSTLRSVKGDFICTVMSPKTVWFEGDEMSLTPATKLMFGINHSIQPSPHWTFEGRTLKEIYDETYII